MALRVWLPLNGNLENQGLSGDATISGSPSYASGGKIADKYLNTGNMISIHAPTIKGSKVCTFSFWAYVVSSTITSDWTLVARIDDQGTNAGSNMRFEVCPKSNYNGIYCFSNHNNGNYGLTNGCIASPAGGYYDQWVHFCFTSDGTTFTRYMNGVKIGTCAYNGEATFNGDFRLANNNKCYKQDVRIYDHCLSPKEVKEISKGLCLHYKLAGPGQENLVKNTYDWKNYSVDGSGQSNIGSYSLENGIYHIIDSNSNTRFYYNRGEKVSINGTSTYTISIKYKWVSGTDKTFRWQLQGFNGDTYVTTIWSSSLSTTIWHGKSGEWQLIECPFNFNNSSINGLRIYIQDGADYTTYTHEYYLKEMKLERGSIATPWCPHTSDALYTALGYNQSIEEDLSGYRYNGNVSGTYSFSTDSPRYLTCADFSKSGHIINSSFNVNGKANTISMWVKQKTSTTQHFLFGTFTSWTGNGIGFYRDANQAGYNCIFKSTSESSYGSLGTGIIALNTWTHIAFTYNGSTIICYINGIEKSRKTYGSNGDIINPVFMIANSKFNNTPVSENEECYISDVRFYATALSAADILELYEVGGAVDSHYNSYAYEFIEE